MCRPKTYVVLAASVAIALIAWSCDRATPVSPRLDGPSLGVEGEGSKCPGGKFTGGGRIDPPDHKDWEDQENPQTGPQISGKLTFGFNVFLGTDGDGNCVVEKGQIQVVHHQPLPPYQVTWHMSIHDGVSETDGQPMPARTYVTSRGGLCVIVGTTSGTTRFRDVTAHEEGIERARMTACDNDEPGSSPGFGPDAFRWETQRYGDTQLQYLTGGNIQAHEQRGGQ